ncbi:MAG: hypothetical protein ACR2K5_08840 [Pseudolabrys sp.]
MIIKSVMLAAVLIAASFGAALAQSIDNKACAQQRATVGAGDQLTVENKNGKDSTLSDKLAKSDGVICPPADVDANIKAPTPEGGKMPVIPPPGTPQNQPNVRPK